MRILSVAYPLLPVSGDSGGGAEQILWQVERGVVAAGHQSVVIAAAGSLVCGCLIQTPQADGQITDDVRRAAQQAHHEAIEAVVRSHSIDLIHFHGLDFIEYLPSTGPPMLATLHLPLDWYSENILQTPRVMLNLVSRSQASSHPATHQLPVISNGVDLRLYRRQAKREEFLLVLARICPEKGIDIALRVAHRLGLKMVVAGPIVPFQAHQTFFAERVEPLLDSMRSYIGPVGVESKIDLLARTRCVVIPSLAAETSSLVAMEAAASGTPVVAWRSGALPEVVEDGITGFIVNSEEEMANATGRVGDISSESCRATAEVRFDAKRMVREYLSLYSRL